MGTDERLHLGEARIVTMRELSQRTAQVMAEVNESGRPALITRHGRFLAVLWPVPTAKIESFLLSNMDEFLNMGEFDDQETEADTVEGDRAAFEADLEPEMLQGRLKKRGS